MNKNSKSYNHGLNEEELAALYAEQAEIEANTYLRTKSPVLKDFQYASTKLLRSVCLLIIRTFIFCIVLVTKTSVKTVISDHGEIPDIETCLKLMEKYKAAWAGSLEIALVELDVAIDDEIANGCEDIFEMIKLLRLRMELNIFLMNEPNYGDTWRELSHRLIEWRVDGPAKYLSNTFQELNNPQRDHYNLTREISVFLMTFLQKKHNFEPNIFSQLNPTNDVFCTAFLSFGDIITTQIQVEMFLTCYFNSVYKWCLTMRYQIFTAISAFYAVS